MPALPSNTTKVHMDSASDDPVQARAELAVFSDAINSIIANINGLFGSDGVKSTALSTVGAQADLDVPSQAEAEAGTATTERVWTAQRVNQGGSPSGSVIDFAGAAAPGTWVLCDGAAYNSVTDTTFADLFTAIGNLYGGSDGTDFQVPDLRGRVVVGQDDMGGTSANRIVETDAHGVHGDTLGAVGGVGQHQLTVAQLAAHTHAYTRYNNGWVQGQIDGSPNVWYGVSTEQTASSGSNAAHTNLQPSMILNKIIKK